MKLKMNTKNLKCPNNQTRSDKGDTPVEKNLVKIK